MNEKAEVLELLAFWKPEQQAAHRFRIWRPVASSLQFQRLRKKKYLLYAFLHITSIFSYTFKTAHCLFSTFYPIGQTLDRLVTVSSIYY